MKTRPIDANKLFDFLTEQLDKETGAYKKGRNVGLNITRSALHDETITPTIAPPPSTPLTLEELREIVQQLEFCGYECEGGPLSMNIAFIRLKEAAYRRKPKEDTPC